MGYKFLGLSDRFSCRKLSGLLKLAAFCSVLLLLLTPIEVLCCLQQRKGWFRVTASAPDMVIKKNIGKEKSCHCPSWVWGCLGRKWVRWECYLAERSGTGRTRLFNLSGEVSLERGTAGRDRWLESKELWFAGGEFTSKCKQGCFRPRNDKGWWGSSPRSSTSLVSYGGSWQMFVRALCNASQRFCCFMSSEAVPEVTVGLPPAKRGCRWGWPWYTQVSAEKVSSAAPGDNS